MDRELLGLLFLAFVPGMVIVVVGTVTAIRKYGAVFLWCLRLEPVRDRLAALLRGMQAPQPVPVEVQRGPYHRNQYGRPCRRYLRKN